MTIYTITDLNLWKPNNNNTLIAGIFDRLLLMQHDSIAESSYRSFLQWHLHLLGAICLSISIFFGLDECPVFRGFTVLWYNDFLTSSPDLPKCTYIKAKIWIGCKHFGHCSVNNTLIFMNTLIEVYYFIFLPFQRFSLSKF